MNGRPTLATIDTLYPGDVIATEPIEGVVAFGGTPTNDTYEGEGLLFVRPVSVTFGKEQLSTAARLARFDQAYAGSGRQYNAIIGLSVLSKRAFAFDFYNRRIWIVNSEEER